MPTVPRKVKPMEPGTGNALDPVEVRMQVKTTNRMLHSEMVVNRHLTRQKLRTVINQVPVEAGN